MIDSCDVVEWLSSDTLVTYQVSTHFVSVKTHFCGPWASCVKKEPFGELQNCIQILSLGMDDISFSPFFSYTSECGQQRSVTLYSGQQFDTQSRRMERDPTTGSWSTTPVTIQLHQYVLARLNSEQTNKISTYFERFFFLSELTHHQRGNTCIKMDKQQGQNEWKACVPCSYFLSGFVLEKL